MAELYSVLDVARLLIAALFVALGAALMLGGSIGLMRFPDFYTRLHASSASDVAGAVLIVLGLSISAWDWRVALKLALLAGLIAVVSPVVLQLLANSAHAGGVSPLAGRYVAPRPGAGRRSETSK